MKRSLLLLMLAACGGEPATTSVPATPAASTETAPVTEPLKVTTTSFPVDWLVSRIGGEAVEQTNVLPVGKDAPFWQPSGDVVAQVATSALIITNGAGFEPWIGTATLPEGIVVDSAEGIPLITIKGRTHSHGKDGEHSHAATDPHVWSDPLAFADQARNIHRALSSKAPAHAALFDANLGTLHTELRSLHEAYTEALKPAASLKLAASHPAFNYLARRYDLTLTSFDLDPNEPPSAAALHDFEHWAAGQSAPILLWEAQPTEQVKAAFPKNTEHVYLDPLEQPAADGSYDYLTQARANLAVFKELFHAP